MKKDEIQAAIDAVNELYANECGNIETDYPKVDREKYPDYQRRFDRDMDWLETQVEIILSALEAQRDDGWQPIETAPKDGTRFLACNSDGLVIIGRMTGASFRNFAADSFVGSNNTTPTKWQPLPPPPTSEGA